MLSQSHPTAKANRREASACRLESATHGCGKRNSAAIEVLDWNIRARDPPESGSLQVFLQVVELFFANLPFGIPSHGYSRTAILPMGRLCQSHSTQATRPIIPPQKRTINALPTVIQRPTLSRQCASAHLQTVAFIVFDRDAVCDFCHRVRIT